MKSTSTNQIALRLLALTWTGTASASAQIIPGFEPSITPAVHVTWPTTTNRAYQVITATNVPGGWLPTGQLIEGTGGQVGAHFDSTNSQRYFRVLTTNGSPLAWLHGTWQGTACQRGEEGQPPPDFTVRVSADVTNRVYSTTIMAPPILCTTKLVSPPDEYSGSQVRFYSIVDSGPCLDAVIYLTRINSTTIAYQAVLTNSPAVAAGVLVKQ